MYQIQHFSNTRDEWQTIGYCPVGDDDSAIKALASHMASTTYKKGMKFRIIRVTVLAELTA